MSKVIVLNSDYSFLGVVSVERAFTYLVKGKVVIEKYVDKLFRTSDNEFLVPMVVRFIKLIRQVYKKKVPWTKKNVLIRDNKTCQYCGSKEGMMTIDHIIPKSRGGKNTFENTVCACFTCNNKKDDRTPREAQMNLKRQPKQPTVSEFSSMMYKTTNLPDIMTILGFK
jgi:5-methylcytosine-specific restriction endonuclease McrA